MALSIGPAASVVGNDLLQVLCDSYAFPTCSEKPTIPRDDLARLIEDAYSIVFDDPNASPMIVRITERNIGRSPTRMIPSKLQCAAANLQDCGSGSRVRYGDLNSLIRVLTSIRNITPQSMEGRVEKLRAATLIAIVGYDRNLLTNRELQIETELVLRKLHRLEADTMRGRLISKSNLKELKGSYAEISSVLDAISSNPDLSIIYRPKTLFAAQFIIQPLGIVIKEQEELSKAKAFETASAAARNLQDVNAMFDARHELRTRLQPPSLRTQLDLKARLYMASRAAREHGEVVNVYQSEERRFAEHLDVCHRLRFHGVTSLDDFQKLNEKILAVYSRISFADYLQTPIGYTSDWFNEVSDAFYYTSLLKHLCTHKLEHIRSYFYASDEYIQQLDEMRELFGIEMSRLVAAKDAS